MFKDLLDRVRNFRTDTVSGDESDGIDTTVLGRSLNDDRLSIR